MLAYFSVVSDGRTLRGVGHIPDGDNHELRGAGQIPDNSSKYPCLILMHGLTGNRNERMLVNISRKLEENRVASLRFDFNGHGESEGRPEESARNFFAPPTSLYLDNIISVVNKANFFYYIRNSFVITLFSLLGIILIVSLVSYSLARNLNHIYFNENCGKESCGFNHGRNCRPHWLTDQKTTC